jgi:phage N-6-adenine-methyltransferase
MNDNIHFSSKTDLWATPQDFFNKYNERYGFTLDVCALPENAKCNNYFTPSDDGLRQPWSGVCWMNPPYGRGIGAWVRKAYESSLNGAIVVCLLPSRTDTRWWHDYCTMGEIEFIRGRLKFGSAENSAPFPSAVVVFNPPKSATKEQETSEPVGIEKMVCDDIAERQAMGIRKYGTTVQDNPLPLADWLQHAYEEALDMAIYLKRAIEEQRDKEGVCSQCLGYTCECGEHL